MPRVADRPGAITLVRTLFDREFYLARHPDVGAAGIDPLEHFLRHGMFEDRAPHPLFDPAFYRAQMPAGCASEPALLHYLGRGSEGALDPHPLFETAHYLAGVEVPVPADQPPLLHFLGGGTASRRSPNPLFDPDYYRRANLLPAAERRHPLLHYVESGWREGCRTHPLFDAAYYLSLRPDVAAAGVDPLAHYLRQGWRETPSTHELFDPVQYCAGFDDPRQIEAIVARGAIIHYARHAADIPPTPHPLFDPAFYARTRGRSAAEGCAGDPFLHFLEVGLRDNLDPHPLFDCTFYLRRHPDVAADGGNPFLHFIRHGAREGRKPNRLVDVAACLSRQPQARDLPFGTLSHRLADRPQALATQDTAAGTGRDRPSGAGGAQRPSDAGPKACGSRAPRVLRSSGVPCSSTMTITASGRANSRIFCLQPPQGVQGPMPAAATTSSVISRPPASTIDEIAPASAQIPCG